VEFLGLPTFRQSILAGFVRAKRLAANKNTKDNIKNIDTAKYSKSKSKIKNRINYITSKVENKN